MLWNGHDGFPFDVQIPNEVTRKAMKASLDGEIQCRR